MKRFSISIVVAIVCSFMLVMQVQADYTITGDGTMTAQDPNYQFINSTYIYTGSGVLDGDILTIALAQNINSPGGGIADIDFEVIIDIVAETGTKAVLGCTGAAAICGGIPPVVTNPVAVNLDGFQDLDISDLDNITWAENFIIDVGAFGLADSESTFLAANNDLCTDNDDDTYFVEGGACGEVDCDDTDATINPGATDIPGDGIDQDCDGSDAPAPPCFISDLN